MRVLLILMLIGISLAAPAAGQQIASPPAAGSGKTAAKTAMDHAKAALAAHGGDKLKKLRSLAIKGSAGLNVFGQQIPASFSTAISGEKYYFEINSPMQSLKQVYDGRETYSSLQGFSLPPVTSLGFPLLVKIGDADHPITELVNKKKAGFRVTTPDGFFTDFFVDERTGVVKGYESAYVVGNRDVTTSVEIDENQQTEGILVPVKYSQRFDLGQMTAYASFKATSVLINSVIEDSSFARPK